ncbi:MAG: XapX domain-containing protein [Colwellia sp.]|nr:XapX domain-containing protein [Colwellia sp.]
MTETLIALVTGAFVGVLFSVLKLPLPAPPVLSGVVGIAGIYLGGIGYQWLIERFFS